MTRRLGAHRGILAAFAGLVALVAVAPTGAGAHPSADHFPYRWKRDRSVVFKFTPSVPAASGARTPVRNAARQWNGLGQALRFVDAGTYPADYDPVGCGTYQRNGVHFRPIDGPSLQTVGVNTVAETRVCLFGGGTNELYSFQMVFDSAEPWYYGSGDAAPTQVDLWSVATHEFGHAAGFARHLDHDGDPAGLCANTAAQPTMCAVTYPGTEHQRTLADHDKHTFDAAY